MEDIYSIYVQASDLDPRARMAWLESIQLSAESRRELDDLLRDLEQYTPGRTKVRTLVLGTVEGSVPSPEQRIGECVGPFRLERLVVDSEGRSAGNMGHVYFARRVDDTFEQTVAVKVIQQIRDDPESRDRFIRERKYLGRLKHPNVVHILDAGALPATADADEQPYFVMEWVEGGLDIATYCLTHDLSLREKVELFCQVCEGVAYAHSQGVVHRDLKPQNVLVDGHGVPRLLDFGISSRPEVDGDSALMRSAMTLAYASPEQLAKTSVGPASDIYSLGVILFEILAGHRPYEVSGDWEADRILVEQMVPPRLGVAFDLNQIVQKALSKDLDRRYRHVDQLVADLRRYLRREPVKASMHMLRQVRLGYVWSALYWLLRYSRKYIKPLLGLALLALLVLVSAAELARRQIVEKVQNHLAARKLAGEAALALERKQYNAAGMLALESAALEGSDLTLRVLQKVIPHIPRRLFSADLPQAARLLSFSPNHSWLALLLESGAVQIHNAETGAVRYQLPASGAANLNGSAACLAWSLDSSHVALFDSNAQFWIWDANSGGSATTRVDFGLKNGGGGFDCSGSAPGAALRYAGPKDWDALLTGGDSALWLTSRGDRTAIANTVSCAPAVGQCMVSNMVSNDAALELLDLRSGSKMVLLRGEYPRGVLSPDGAWAALQLPGDITQVCRMGKDVCVPAYSFGSPANPSRPVRFQAGGRLLLDEGEQWRIFLPRLNESLLSRHVPVVSSNAPESASLHNPQVPKVNVLLAMNDVGTDPVAIPTEGPVRARAGDEVSGSFAVADRSGQRLSMWRLPEWPGTARYGGAVMGSDSLGRWAAGWTRNNALVTFSPLDGSVERVLQGEVAPDGPDFGLKVWALGGSQWFLSQGGDRLTSWDPRSGKALGTIKSANERLKLTADGSGRWLAVGMPEARRSELYEMPGMRHAMSFPGYEVAGISAVAGGDIAILLGSDDPAKVAGTKRVAHYRLQILTSNGTPRPQVREIAGEIGFGAVEFNTIERAVGPPCASTSKVAKEPREILFPMARVQAGITTGCAVMRVNLDRDSIRVDDASYPVPATPGLSVRTATALPGTVHMELQRTRDQEPETVASELLPEGLQWSWQPAAGSIAFHTGETWREVLFSFAELKSRFCAGGVVNLPPDFAKRYELSKLSGCEK